MSDEPIDPDLAYIDGLADEGLSLLTPLIRIERRLAAASSAVCSWQLVNSAADLMIWAGRYRESLALPERWSEPARARGVALDRESWLLFRINRVEALYNLGELDRARAALDGLADDRELPMIDAAWRLQSAWLACLEGDPDQAIDALAELDPEPLANYGPELHYTWARVHLIRGEPAEARDEVRVGLAQAERASSRRNGLFLLAEVEHAQQRTVPALRAYLTGACHRYRGQGGPALLAWAELLDNHGLAGLARKALGWCAERDPQSPAGQAALLALGP